jgi:hypothetical protein
MTAPEPSIGVGTHNRVGPCVALGNQFDGVRSSGYRAQPRVGTGLRVIARASAGDAGREGIA